MNLFNIDLVNAIAFGHDLGHCPFGHAGEREMQNMCKEKPPMLLEV